MKTSFTLLIFTLIAFTSCDNSSSRNNQQQETPKTLDDNSSLEIVKKRGNDDLVESLYDELESKPGELRDFRTKVDNIKQGERDSTELFNKYDQKNKVYYNSANTHLEQVQDSLLKNRLKSLIASSLVNYNSKIESHTNLLKSINAKTATLNDLYTVLKITRTLPLIEKYQDSNKPTTKSLVELSKQLVDALNMQTLLLRNNALT